MKTQDFIHPEDEKALRALNSLSIINPLIRIYMKYGCEDYYLGENLGTMVKVSETSYPALEKMVDTISTKIGIKTPQLFIYNDPYMNAFTYGVENPFVAISSSMLERMNVEEVTCVIAHECGHIKCKHSFYKTLLHRIENLGYAVGLISETALGPIYLALQYWNRRSEFSADRCAAVLVGEKVFQRTMLKLTSGVSEINGDDYQLVKQAKDYFMHENSSWWNKIQQNCRVAFNSHPQIVCRAYEIERWKESFSYQRLRSSLG